MNIMLTEEQKNDELVKSLLAGGFSEDVISGWINSGKMTLQKSEEEEEEEKEETEEKTEIEDGGKEEGEDEVEKAVEAEDEKEVNDGENEIKKCGKPAHKSINWEKRKKNEDSIAKSFNFDSIVKSISSEVEQNMSASNEELMKSIPAAVEGVLTPIMDKIEKSLNMMASAIEVFGERTPNFKGADLSRTIIEKSFASGEKDDAGRVALSVTRDRNKVRELISKAIDEEADVDIQKSLQESTADYLLDPYCDKVGEAAAMYLFTKKGIRLQK